MKNIKVYCSNSKYILFLLIFLISCDRKYPLVFKYKIGEFVCLKIDTNSIGLITGRDYYDFESCGYYVEFRKTNGYKTEYINEIELQKIK